MPQLYMPRGKLYGMVHAWNLDASRDCSIQNLAPSIMPYTLHGPAVLPKVIDSPESGELGHFLFLNMRIPSSNA